MTGGHHHHPHDHTHDHDHDHGPLESIDHVHGGAPALDIGGDIGALHVLLDDDWVGRELFLRTDDPGFSIHTGCWIRHVGDGHLTSALFVELVEGEYWVLDAGGADVVAVTIRGGELSELDLRVQMGALPVVALPVGGTGSRRS